MKPNWPLLAGIRFVLAMVVVFWHISMIDVDQPLTRLASAIGNFGAVGAFFIISGFSIAHSIQHEAKGFYARRADRLCPVYFVCFVFSFLPFIMASQRGGFYGNRLLAQPPEIQDLIATCLMIPSVLGEPIISFGTSWSLGIEVVFYAFAPLFLRLSKRRFQWLLASAAVYYVIQATGWPVAQPPHALRGIWPILSCAVWWLLGWYLYQNRQDQSSLKTILLLVAIPCLFALNPQSSDIVSSYIHGDLGPMVMTGVCLACVFGHHVVISDKMKRVAIYLGDLSYPLYLAHWPIYWLLAVLDLTNPVFLWFYPLAALVGAAFVLHCVDYPYRALVRRRVARQQDELVSVPASS